MVEGHEGKEVIAAVDVDSDFAIPFAIVDQEMGEDFVSAYEISADGMLGADNFDHAGLADNY